MFFTLFFAHTLSWSPQMLSIAFEIGMRHQTAEFRSRMLNAFRISGDDFTRAAEGIQWLYTVEKPPYNIPSFDHWHFDYYVYNPENLSKVAQHTYTDCLYYDITQTQYKLFNKDSSRVWPFSFNLKMYLTLICDTHSIFHANELFSKQFPDGDDHGRKFTVKHNGKDTSLYDFWESGCGEFKDINWNSVNSTADQILKEYPKNYYDGKIDIPWSSVMSATRSSTIKYGYSSLKNQDSLSENYIRQCKQITHQQIARAGYAIQVSLNRIAIDNYILPKMTIEGRKSEAYAWSLMAILLPATIAAIIRRFCGSN